MIKAALSVVSDDADDPTAERTWLAGVLQLFVDAKLDAARDALAACDRKWLADPDVKAVAAAFDKAAKLDSPTITDLNGAVGKKKNGARSLFVDILHKAGKPDSMAYGMAVDRSAAAIEEAYYSRVISDQVRALDNRLALGQASPDELGQMAQTIARLQDAAERRDPTSVEKLQIRPVSGIEAKAANWLWPGRIIGNGLTILTGPVGASKSLLTIDIATRVSLGSRWPDGTGSAPKGEVILFGAEDDVASVVRPRLEAAGADLERVFVCDGASSGRSDEPQQLVLERHIRQVRELLKSRPDCRLLVFDPLPDYIAADGNSSGEVRAAITPLVKVAQEFGVAVLAILHQNKKQDLGTVARISGSGAYSQLSRQILALADHPDDDATDPGRRRVLVVAKSNYVDRGVGQAYRLHAREGETVKVEWVAGTLTMDADQLYRKPTGGKQHDDRRADAVDALRGILSDGEWHGAAEVIEQLNDMGVDRRQRDYAANQLCVHKQQSGRKWEWRLPRIMLDNGDSSQPEAAFDAFAPTTEIDRWADFGDE
jgi:hypothetical protein